MGSVKTGITLIYWGIVILLLAIISGILVPFIVKDLETFVRLMMVLGVVVILANIITIVGKVMCLGAPQETGAREFIIAAVVADGLSLLISLAGLFQQLPSYAPQVANLLSMAGFVLFMLFLKQVAIFIQRDDLAQAAASVLTLGIILIVTAILTGLLAFVAPVLVLITGLVMLVVGILFVIRYVGLIAKMKDAI